MWTFLPNRVVDPYRDQKLKAIVEITNHIIHLPLIEIDWVQDSSCSIRTQCWWSVPPGENLTRFDWMQVATGEALPWTLYSYLTIVPTACRQRDLRAKVHVKHIPRTGHGRLRVVHSPMPTSIISAFLLSTPRSTDLFDWSILVKSCNVIEGMLSEVDWQLLTFTRIALPHCGATSVWGMLKVNVIQPLALQISSTTLPIRIPQ